MKRGSRIVDVLQPIAEYGTIPYIKELVYLTIGEDDSSRLAQL